MNRLLWCLPIGLLGCSELPDVNLEEPADCGSQPFFADGDGDGWGAGEATLACSAPEGFVALDGDCDDDSSFFHPGAREDDCTDPADYNCDGSVMYEDGDGDGWGACEDCNDADSDASPGGDEVCDGVDNDCDGEVDNYAQDATTWYYDADQDGVGGEISQLACEAPARHVADAGDCDDNDASAFPGGVEQCDEADNDCDGEVDEDEAMDVATWYVDGDGDGHGDPDGESLQSCEPPEGYAKVADDCDDGDAMVSPSALEYCNEGTDDDCDGLVDEDDAADVVHFYPDVDGDGFGCDGCGVVQCAQPEGYVDNPLDCDDGEATTYPGAEESCDEVDNDCDVAIDEDAGTVYFPDGDGDGFGDGAAGLYACEAPGTGYVTEDGDCDDADESVSPAAVDTCNGVDDDCDGLAWDDADPDGDGYFTCESALWIHTDTGGNSTPDSPGRFRASEAAEMMGEYGLSWEAVDLRDITLTEELLASYSVVVLYGKGSDGPLESAEHDALEAWVEGGGGLLYHGWHPSQAACEMVNSLPESFGVTCDDHSKKVSGSGYTVVSHPVTTDVEEIRVLGGEPWTTRDAGEVLVRTADGWPLVIAAEPGAGRVVALADEWPLYNEGTRTTHDISAVDNRQLVDNTWCWLSGESCDLQEEADTGEAALTPEPAGTEEDPAASCYELLLAYPDTDDGWYFIGEGEAATESFCDMQNGGWTLLYEDDFEAGPQADWDQQSTTSCGDFGTLLGGYGVTAGGEMTVALDAGYVSHSETRVVAEIAALDSWDGETLYVKVDGLSIWDESLNNHASDGEEVCGWSRARNPFWDVLHDVDETVPHLSDTLTLSVGSTLNQASTDESYGLAGVEVWVR